MLFHTLFFLLFNLKFKCRMSSIDYVKYASYLDELLCMYRKNKSLAGMSKIAKKYGVTALTKELFFERGLNKVDGSLTIDEVKSVRDELSAERRKRYYRSLNYRNDDNNSADDLNGSDDIPDGFELVQICKEGDYRYALRCDSAIDNASCCMYYINASRSKKERELYDELSKVLNDAVIELYAGRVPLPCVNGDMDYAPLYMAKCSNDGMCYFLASSSCILVGLAWICGRMQNETK